MVFDLLMRTSLRLICRTCPMKVGCSLVLVVRCVDGKSITATQFIGLKSPVSDMVSVCEVEELG